MATHEPVASTSGSSFLDANDILDSRPALALHDFDGSAEDGELSFKKGDTLDILIEEASQGWSLALRFAPEGGEIREGLVPVRYYRLVDTEPSTSGASTIRASSSTRSRLERGLATALSLDHLPLPNDFSHFSHCQHEPSTSSSLETVSVDGAIFELATPSTKAAMQEHADYFTFASPPPSGETQLETEMHLRSPLKDQQGPKSPSMSHAAAMLQTHLSGLPASSSAARSSSLPSLIQNAAFRKALAHTEQPDQPSFLPNLQPLPPIFPKDPAERKAELSLDIRGTSQRVKAASQHSVRSVMPGGWVDSGAEDWITGTRDVKELGREERRKLQLSVVEEEETQEALASAAQEWVIDTSLSWSSCLAPFSVSVHSQHMVRDGQMGYTVYKVTSFLPAAPSHVDEASEVRQDPTLSTVTVPRRFSHFVALEDALRRTWSGLVFPTLPNRGYLGRHTSAFLEQRRRDLERWLSRLLRHPVLRSSRSVTVFLSEQVESQELLRTLNAFDKQVMFDKIFHDEFAVDLDAAQEEGKRFQEVVKREETSGSLSEVREAMEAERKQARDASRCSERVAKAVAGLASSPCWTDLCTECETTNSLLKHCARAFLQVSSIEEQGCSDALKTVELIQENTRPYSQHASLLELHSSAVGAWKTIETAGADLSHNSGQLKGSESSEQAKMMMADRCQTVLNVTAAEMNRHHQERQEDRRQIALEAVQNRIKVHEAALASFKQAEAEILSAAPLLAEGEPVEEPLASDGVKRDQRDALPALSTWTLGDRPPGASGLGPWAHYWRRAISSLATESKEAD